MQVCLFQRSNQSLPRHDSESVSLPGPHRLTAQTHSDSASGSLARHRGTVTVAQPAPQTHSDRAHSLHPAGHQGCHLE